MTFLIQCKGGGSNICHYLQASRKGVSETISGLVFSFYALVMFVSSPVFGKIVSGVTNSLKLTIYSNILLQM